MTALGAYWRLSGSSSDPRAACERILRSQALYGTDPAIVLQPSAELAIGRRLHRLLPEDRFDNAPVMGGGGRWSLVADVRLDARDELRGSLNIESNAFRSLSDTDVALRAIERWELDAIPRLVGDFALVLWDARERRLILARDFLGQRPLHYHRADGFFGVASMPKGLHALPSVPREADGDSVAEFMALLPDRSSRSFFRGVERVLPGEMLIATDSGVERRRYWNFQRKRLGLRQDEYPEAVRESLDLAVAARLRGAENSVGAQLSGGLDSSIVATSAALLLAPKGKVIAFTAAPRQGFESDSGAHRLADESAHAAATAALYPNMEHLVMRGRGQSPLDELDRNFYLYDRPVLNLCNNTWVADIMKQAQARRLSVLLIGNSGNVTISYDGADSLSARLSSGRLFSLVREIAALHRNGEPVLRLATSTIGPLVPSPLWRAMKRLAGRDSNMLAHAALRPERARSLERKAGFIGDDTSFQPGSDGFDPRASGLQWVDPGNYNKGFLGGWGIDVRDPTADRRLVELCLSIPPEQFVGNGRFRAIARQAFGERLPDVVAHERRKGYQAADWHEGLRAANAQMKAELESIARVPQANGIVDVDRLQALLAASPADWNGRRAEIEYRLALLRGVSAGHFLRRAVGAN